MEYKQFIDDLHDAAIDLKLNPVKVEKAFLAACEEEDIRCLGGFKSVIHRWDKSSTALSRSISWRSNPQLNFSWGAIYYQMEENEAMRELL